MNEKQAKDFVVKPAPLCRLVTSNRLVAGVAAGAKITLESTDSITEIVSIQAYVSATGAPAKLLAPTTDYTFVPRTNQITCVTDQSANKLFVTFL